MREKISPSLYCSLLEKAGIIPNFFLSIPYLEYSGAEIYRDRGWVYAVADDFYIFPPIPNPLNFLGFRKPKEFPVWSDFENNPKIGLKEPEFLDFEYMLDCLQFNDLSGGKWATYRKNIRKWAKHNSNWSYNYYFNLNKSRDLLIEWMEVKGDDLQDGEFLVDYILDGGYKDFSGVEVQSLYDWKGKLMGINVWDENYEFVNYRFCIVKPDEPFLDEFMRHKFYTDPVIQRKKKMINDGGTLGNPGLAKFKNKLNPFKVRKVRSWKLS